MSECEHGQLDVVLMCKRCESRRATFRSDTVAVLPVSETEHYKEAARLLRGWEERWAKPSRTISMVEPRPRGSGGEAR